MTKIYDGDIPFTETGDQLHYADPFYTRQGFIVWKRNCVITGNLTITNMDRGRSAAYFTGVLNGHGVVVFMKDLLEMLPHMTKGAVRGDFAFCKRGQNYGCKLVK